MGLDHKKRFHRNHRVLSRARWSSREASRILLGLLVEAPSGTTPVTTPGRFACSPPRRRWASGSEPCAVAGGPRARGQRGPLAAGRRQRRQDRFHDRRFDHELRDPQVLRLSPRRERMNDPSASSERSPPGVRPGTSGFATCSSPQTRRPRTGPLSTKRGRSRALNQSWGRSTHRILAPCTMRRWSLAGARLAPRSRSAPGPA
jgi:hypothetical protein